MCNTKENWETKEVDSNQTIIFAERDGLTYKKIAKIGYELADAILAQEADGLDRSEWLLKKAKELVLKVDSKIVYDI
jgi:hypothetical protein